MPVGTQVKRLRRVAPLLWLVILLILMPEPPLSAVQDGSRVRFPADVPPRNDILLDNHVPVRMRDGVTLYADVYRPTGNGRHPVILSITPYSTERFPTAYDAAVYFAQRGYVYVFQDVRGRHESEGVWTPFVNDEKDAYDTVEWAAKQPWSDGKVAMQGGSYLGQNQWRAAQANPPSLVTIFPMVASTSIYHDWITLNGGWRLSFNFGWGPVRQESRIMQNPGPHTDRRTSRDSLRPGAAASAAQHDAAAGGAERAFLRRVAGQPRLQQLLEAIQRRGAVRQDRGPGAYVRRLVRHLQPGDAAWLRRDEPEGRDRAGPAHESPRDRPLGTRSVAEVRSARFRTHRQCRRPDAPAALVRPLAEGNRQRARERSARQAVRHGPQRVGLRTRVSAGPHRLPASVLQQRQARRTPPPATAV